MAQLAFPDLHLTTDIVLAGESKVIAYWVSRGTQKGELRIADLPRSKPSNRPVAFSEAAFFRVVDGKIKEGWHLSDRLTMLEQMGSLGRAGTGLGGGGEEPRMPEPPAVPSGSVTSSEDGQAVMRRLIDEVWNEADVEVADEIFHPLAVSPSAPQLPPGGAGVKGIVTMFRSSFPDFHISIEDMVAEENGVAALLTESGTHEGEFMGIAPTGRHVQFQEIGILRFSGGKVVESWYETDMLGLMRQLGAVGYPSG